MFHKTQCRNFKAPPVVSQPNWAVQDRPSSTWSRSQVQTLFMAWHHSLNETSRFKDCRQLSIVLLPKHLPSVANNIQAASAVRWCATKPGGSGHLNTGTS